MRPLRLLIGLTVLEPRPRQRARCRAAKRVALVIGNSAYRHAEELPNPRNDATAIAAVLARVGFEVDLQTDLDQLGMQHALRDFGLKAEGADAAVVYYAGHGIQVAGENYLLPVDASLERERDLLYEALPLNLVLGEVAQAQKLGLVILDACRNNPLAEHLRRALGPIRSRLIEDGLARVENLPSNTMIAFATRPGEVAVDGSGNHSPYTGALLAAIQQPGLELDLLFRKVRDVVLAATAYRQEPRTFDALGAEPFYFVEPKPNQYPQLPPLAALQILDNASAQPIGIEPSERPGRRPDQGRGDGAAAPRHRHNRRAGRGDRRRSDARSADDRDLQSARGRGRRRRLVRLPGPGRSRRDRSSGGCRSRSSGPTSRPWSRARPC